MSKAHQLEGDARQRLKALYRASGIRTRYTVLPDYARATQDYSFFPPNEQLEPFPGTASRMALYRQEALPLATQAVEQLAGKETIALASCTHLIVASCTGMYAPGLDIDLVHALGLRPGVERSAINFMGCYAAVTALKLADHICRANAAARVLVVCVELCTLHFQKKTDEDNLLANSLFGDGAAAVWLSGQPPAGPSIRLDQFWARLIPEASKDMAWQVGDYGFEMRLSSYVPAAIKTGIADMTREILAAHGIGQDDIRYYANHPGGKKILQVIEEELQIGTEDHRFSYEVLQRFGNMSSPTVLFVLCKLWREASQQSESGKILSFAFGPGLTLESGLFTWLPA